MECLASLRPRTSGVFYDGDVAPRGLEPAGHLLFYLPNGVTPYAELYTIEVLTLFGKLFEIQPSRWERIIVDELSLVPVLQKKVSVLSKGNLQRLLIALALMSPQPFLALDEPFDGLDLHQTQAMMDILRGLRAQKRTLLLCIHQLNDAERICDRLLLLSGGRMVGIGTLDQLRAQAGLSEGNLESIFLSLTGDRITSRPSPRGDPLGHFTPIVGVRQRFLHFGAILLAGHASHDRDGNPGDPRGHRNYRRGPQVEEDDAPDPSAELLVAAGASQAAPQLLRSLHRAPMYSVGVGDHGT